MFTPRTTPVENGTQPYNWTTPTIYECTWYCYYRALEVGFSAPCWWDRATKTGSYTNAKDWIANFREPWEVKPSDYTPVAGDILVYNYADLGHVIFCETEVMTSEYRSGREDSFRNAKIGDFNGELIGVLHYPYEPVKPVERNENVDQIQTTDDSLRIRTKPSLNGEIVGHVQIGYYNVLDIKEADGYTWYKLAKDRWCANDSTIFLPSEDDIMAEIERFVNATKTKIKTLENKNKEMVDDFASIRKIADKYADD